MNADELEFAISQYLDGTLPESARRTLELCLGDDAGARAMLDEYRRLDGVLKAMPAPLVRWDALAASISAAIEADEERQAQAYRMPAWVRSFAAPLSLAASLMIATGLGVQVYRSRHSASASPAARVAIANRAGSTAAESSIIVIGPRAEKSSTPAEVEVAIGPSDAVKDEPILVQYSNDLVSRPSHVSVASGVIPAHDSEALQFDMQ